ncbi:unnamed protein product [Cuscuta campestris]|uniref:Uncharacterized protein n=1 Tax=Cuscuta campestris TaxID=132261 RepID=A0A484LZR3_9ASTE|nr:unnamed protein product [Cuscuta campestris]
MLSIAANFPFTRYTYPAVSTFTPCAAVLMAIANEMDTIMASTRHWTDKCMGWVPPFSQIYFGMLFYIQTLKAMLIAGHLATHSELRTLLSEFEMLYPLSTLWIPGPLVSFFKNLACFTPDPERFGNVTPSICQRPGWTRASHYTFGHMTTHLPNLSFYFSRLYSVCDAATRDGTTEISFARDVDGPRFLATIFGRACDNEATAEHIMLRSPGASLVYAGNLRLWQKAALQMNSELPGNLNIDNDDVEDSWVSALRLDHSFYWFSTVAAMMARYCQFWKDSTSLEDCSPNGSAAGAVRCCVIDNHTSMFDIPAWTEQAGKHNSFVHGNRNQMGHYALLSYPTLMLNASTALQDIPETDIQAALTYAYNLYLDKTQRRDGVTGPFWTIRPLASGCNHFRTIQGIAALLTRVYHCDSRLGLDRH